jgi:glycosyltransferase involved in cell wall biosynthesis
MISKIIVHITNAHIADDPRIFSRHCSSLSKYGHEVVYIGPFGNIRNIVNGVRIIGLNASKSRIHRYFVINLKIFIEVIRLKPRLVEFHDPDLVFLALIFRLFNIKVIGNLHEDIANQVLNKDWLSNFSKFLLHKALSFGYPKLIKIACNGIVSATHSINKPYKNNNSTICRNFPSNFFISDKDVTSKKYIANNGKLKLVYVGVIEKRRGIDEMIAISKSTLVSSITFVGKFSPPSLESEVRLNTKGNNKINIIGEVPHKEVFKYITNNDVGICFLEDNPAYAESIPTKIFEYAAFGLPVIANNFDSISSLNNQSQFGILLDRIDYHLVENALLEILNNYDKYSKSSIASSNLFSWGNEEGKYLKMINNVL